jgi:hypothetical protein
MKPALKYCCWLAFLAAALLASGCASPDAENRAERPWNAPANWEYGLPPSMMQGR